MLQHVHASLFSYGFLRFALDSLDFGSQADDAGVHSIGLCTVQEKKRARILPGGKSLLKFQARPVKKNTTKKETDQANTCFHAYEKKSG